MTVYFNSSALNHEYTKSAIGKMQTTMDGIQKQINTAKKYEHFYDLPFSEAQNLLYQAHVIENDYQSVSILKEGFYKINEMSTQLDQLQNVLRNGLLSWQDQYNLENNVKDKEIKRFGENMLKNFETILNKRSEYDGTYLFSGEDMGTKPVNFSEDNYYKGSKYNVSFTYGEGEIELDFNAGDKSISNIVTLLKNMKEGLQKNTGEVFDKLKSGLDQIIESKKGVDLKSRYIKERLEHEETFLSENIDKYNAKTKTDNILALTDLMDMANNLQAIYTSNKVLLSTRLVDFL